MEYSNSKIRVLQAIRQGLIGGGESHVLSLVEHIDKSQFEPIVLSFTDGPMIDRLNDMGIKNYVIPTTRAFDFFTWKKVSRLLKEENISLVHAHGSRAASNLFWPARYFKIPTIYTIHGWSFHDEQSSLVKKLRITSEKFLTNKMNTNISVSASNQRTGKKYFNDFVSEVVNNGIDMQKFNPVGSYPDIRKELNIPADCTLIGYIARITLQKDPFTLLKAFKEVLKTATNIHLLMVGDGELKEQAIKLAKELRIDKHITFEPFRQDVPAILNAIDIYCLPSLWEGLPIGLLEAMAMGCAVVATAVDGSKEIIKNDQNGLLVNIKEPHKLAAAIISLHNSKIYRNELQQNAIKTISLKYNVSTMTDHIEKIYANLLYDPLMLNHIIPN